MTAPSSSPEDWAGRRVLAIVAHPDDEVLGCGALLAGLRDVRVVHVTDGAPRRGRDTARLGLAGAADHAAVRHAEALAALALAGVTPDRVMCLGVPDQEASTDLVGIARRLAPLVDRADLVLTHAFEGGHSDHDAVAFAAAAAGRLAGGVRELFEMPFYYGDETGWVRQRFLPSSTSVPLSPALTLALSPCERLLKRRMLAAHATQRDTLSEFDLDAERFRRAPAYDFSRRPHAGPLLYERHGWNLTWPDWTDRIRGARAALGAAAP